MDTLKVVRMGDVGGVAVPAGTGYRGFPLSY